MSYVKTEWKDYETVIEALNLNNMEDGIEAANNAIDSLGISDGIISTAHGGTGANTAAVGAKNLLTAISASTSAANLGDKIIIISDSGVTSRTLAEAFKTRNVVLNASNYSPYFTLASNCEFRFGKITYSPFEVHLTASISINNVTMEESKTFNPTGGHLLCTMTSSYAFSDENAVRGIGVSRDGVPFVVYGDSENNIKVKPSKTTTGTTILFDVTYNRG